MDRSSKLSLILKKLTNRFIASILLIQSFLIIFAIIVAVVFVHYKIEKYVMLDAEEKMLSSINLIGNNLINNHLSLDNECPWMFQDSLSRYTIMNEDGTAVCDSWREPSGMKNHSNKKEVIAARRYGIGTDVHMSNTTKFEMLYVAKKVEINRKIYFIRLATSLVKIKETIVYLDKIMLIILLPILIISILLGAFVGFKTNKPLNSVLEKIFNIKILLSPQTQGENWPSSVQNDPWPLLEKMVNDTGKDVGELLSKYTAENIKLNTLMNNIPDAIVYTNVNGKILFCNNAFSEFFLKGESFIDVINIKDIIRDKTFNEYAERCLTLGEQQILNEFKVSDFDNEESNFFKITFIPLKFEEKSHISNLLIIFHDLTQTN
ncbi:MAG: PAS domain-containing protein [Bacteriovoracaceae bacterium]